MVFGNNKQHFAAILKYVIWANNLVKILYFIQK